MRSSFATLLAAVLASLACGGTDAGDRTDSAGEGGGSGHRGGSGHGGVSIPRGGSAGEEHGAPTAGRGGAAGAASPECDAVAPTECPSPAPRYADVAPIFERRCVVCHAGRSGGPWPLNTYGHVATWRDTIRAALLQCVMPPADSGVTLELSESELILAWIRCGMPP